MRHLLLALACATSLVGTAAAQKAPPANAFTADEAAKAIAFFEKLLPAMAAQKTDCPKMAAAIDTAVNANVPLLRSLKKGAEAGKTLPADAETKLTTLLTQHEATLSACQTDPAVQAAMQRLEDPDRPSAAQLVDIKPPVAADLETYTKGIPGKGDLIATIKTGQGTVKCQLFADKAPMTVANFVGLATGKKPWLDPKTNKVQKKKPYYDGLIFHRVIPDFMIQGGDPTGTGTSGPGYTFADETTPADKMVPGTLAMANAGPSTNGSQFFITESAPEHLNGKHTIFGVCQPLDVVKKIARVKTAGGDKPETPVKMKITISRGTL